MSTLAIPTDPSINRSKVMSSEEQDILEGRRFVNPSEVFTNSKGKSSKGHSLLQPMVLRQQSPPRSSTAGLPIRASPSVGSQAKAPAIEEDLVRGSRFDPSDVFVSPEGKRVALPASEENAPKRQRLEITS